METEIGVSFEEIPPPTNTTTRYSFWFKIKRKKLRFRQKNNNMESIHEKRDGKQDENS